MQRRNKYRLPFSRFGVVIILSIYVLLAGCTATRFLKNEQTFYAGAKIELESHGRITRKSAIKEDLQSFITPKPNGKLFGSRPGVWFYFIAGQPKKEKGFRYFIKYKVGKAPVLLSNVNPAKTATILEGRLNNEGYFRSTVSYDVVTKGKTSTVYYKVNLERPYRIRNIDDTVLTSLRYLQMGKLRDGSLLKKNQRYSLDRLENERTRIKESLEDRGYYYFDSRYLMFEVDTTAGDHKFDVRLFFERGMPSQSVRPYRMKQIDIYPAYSLGNDSLLTTGDTTRINGYRYIDNQHIFRPEIIARAINIKPDSLYSKTNHEYTLSRLMSLKTFKFVNVKFSDRSDSTLNADVFLTPLLKKSIRFQVQGVSKSNNFVGPGVEVTFTNRNTFRGAELFQLKVNGAYEYQISRQQSGKLNAIEFGAEASLSVFRFLTPIRIRYTYAKYLPQTQFKLSYNFQQRLQYFKLTTFNASYGYVWRETTLRTHELFPIDVSFVKSGKTSDAFNEILANNPTLTNSFQDQFIPGLRYSFTLNTQLREDIEAKYLTRRQGKSDFYFNSTISLAGNVFKAVKTVVGSDGSTNEIFNLPYSQFVMGSVDFRYYRQINKHQRLATRLIMGAGYAYGNSSHLPYIKQFSIGGSSSLRAFPARSLGPGAYNVRTDETIKTRNYFIDQRGDMKLEGNVEYRFDILKALKGAVFADAGNIWLLNKDSKNDSEVNPDKFFNPDNFLNQLAAGAGVGLRYDFSFFVLRLDTAIPIRKPYLEPGDMWVTQKQLVSGLWLRDNMVFNIAIGYPF